MCDVRKSDSPVASQARCNQAVDSIAKSRENLLACYNYPIEHSRNLHTTNLVEGVFATIGPRTVQTRACPSRKRAFAIVLRLVLSQQQKCRRLSPLTKLVQVLEGVHFRLGVH